MSSNLKNALLIGVPIVAIAVVVILLIKGKGDKPPANCITIPRSEIINWFATGWDRSSSSSYIPSLSFKPAGGTGGISVNIYPVDSACNPIYDSGKPMKIADPACVFPEARVIGDTRYDLTPSDASSNGSLIDFEYINLIPKTGSEHPDTLYFEIQMVNSSGQVVSRGLTKPCPPYCPTKPL